MRNVVITGASTGIGRAAAERLARTMRVFAGVRSQADFDRMETLGPNVVPVMLEVTDPDSVAHAAASVGAATGGRVEALVNNAGIVVPGPLEIVEISEVRRQFDVNVLGPLMVTQAFMPLIRAATGRIITIGSISGKFAAPFVGPYAMSKFAVEAMSDALRLELAPFGIKVILIEPGAIATPLWARTNASSAAATARLPAAALALYGAAMRKMQDLSANIERGAIPAERVAAAIDRAIVLPRPRARYLIGTDARVQLLIARLPEALRDRLITTMLGRD